MHFNPLSYLLLIGLPFLIAPVHADSTKTEEFTLENGLHIIVKPDHRSPVVTSQIWYKVGSSYEQEGHTGLSHFLEHLMFKGTEKHPVGDFSRIMSENGASQNAFTSADFTAFFQTLEKSRLAISFELEADRMRALQFDDSELQKEKRVVMEERRNRTEDEPSSLLQEHFRAVAYTTSSYQNPVVGWMNDIENYNMADVRAWYQQWYAPNNATIVVVGDVEPQAVFQLAKQYFANLSPSVITPPPARREIEQLGERRVIVKRPAKLPILTMGYKVPTLATIAPADVTDVYALEVLAYTLSLGNSARLDKEVVRRQEIANSASATYDLTARLESLFTLSGVPTQKHTITELETALREQITRLQTTLVDKAELERVKTLLIASNVYEQDSVFYQAMKIGIWTTVGLDWHLLEQYVDNIKAVTPEQIQAVAKKYLIDDHLTIGQLEPLPIDSADENRHAAPAHAIQGAIQ
ncbi:M16 family metallopeptidase [Beggiatoa leptomitoformis]|uniref:Insulinase family protein n=1 Tax=Beggiatoa leptomitoformis TaxID=288004 RepID=A0A2N9YEZ4_9GAMM|nr:pitrilysin family protein [Beggiatoa leptomitoformis]ALG68605.1 insulinase family protein [Beggiatoa leptomitoformis]AUI69050.1 insulinase family protein [Beggiatoa leptomitoformis]